MTPQLDPAKPGPHTEEGKARTRLNAFRHGLTGQVFVFAAAEADTYRSHCAAIREHYQPAGPLEEALADQVATGIWRLQRVAAIEEGIFASDAAAQPEPVGPAHAWLEQGRSLSLLSTYEGRIRRALDRDKAELLSLQNTRNENTARQAALAKSKAATRAPQPLPVTPQPDEFVFSSDPTAAKMVHHATVPGPIARRDAA